MVRPTKLCRARGLITSRRSLSTPSRLDNVARSISTTPSRRLARLIVVVSEICDKGLPRRFFSKAPSALAYPQGVLDYAKQWLRIATSQEKDAATTDQPESNSSGRFGVSDQRSHRAFGSQLSSGELSRSYLNGSRPALHIEPSYGPAVSLHVPSVARERLRCAREGKAPPSEYFSKHIEVTVVQFQKVFVSIKVRVSCDADDCEDAIFDSTNTSECPPNA
ncbi:hypothetical protein LY76DRAFT_602183 [Colletotrichum caudatum]|nr:hypothetical protein LY76DRAFT_602183 [Colletotrichum caudatum]